MDRILRFTSLLPVVVLCSACGTAVTSPDSAAAVMLGEWSYGAPHRLDESPTLNAGLQVRITIDSLERMRFWGRVTVWFAGDVGIAPSAFGRVAGRLGDSNSVSLEIPRASTGGSTVMVMGELAGDVLTIRNCYSGADPGPFAIGTAFERVTIR